MKRLKRMLLINWYYFQKEMIDFGTLTFLTGKNATGKSVIIDAMQLVLLSDTSGSYFNKSANGRSHRTLSGYLRGELNDNEASGFNYLRNDAFTSYIVLEFYDEEKARSFTAGCCFDVYSDNDIPHVFFGYYGAIPDDCYIVEDVPRSIERLRQWLRTEHPESTCTVTGTNKEFRDYLYGKLGGLQSKFSDLFKKAVPFDPIANIQKFITDFVFGNEQVVDIRAMQETIESYTQMEQEAARLQERKEQLEKIAALFAEYRRFAAQLQTNQYIADRAGCELAANQCAELEQKMNALLQKEEALQAQLSEAKRTHAEISNEYIKIRTELDSNGVQRRIEELEALCRSRQQQMNAWQADYDRREKSYRRITADWNALLHGCTALPPEEGCAFGERTLEKLQSFRTLQAHAEHAAAQLSDKTLAQLDEAAITQADGHMQALWEGIRLLQYAVDEELRQAAQEAKDLLQEKEKLQAGQQSYPPAVTALRTALESRLQAQFGAADVRIVAELWDVRDPEWRNAVEGYLNSQRYSILVPPAQYQAAAAGYNQVKDSLHIHGVAVVDLEAIRRARPEARPGSLAEEIVTEDADARLYADFLLGRVMKCHSLAEHNLQNISITKGCMLYQKKAIRHLNPAIWARPLLGQGARQLRLAQIEDALRQICDIRDQRNRWAVQMGRWSSPAAPGPSELEDWQTAREGLAQIPAARLEIQHAQEELNKIDRAPLFALQERSDKLKQKLEECETRVNKIQRELGSTGERYKHLTDTAIPAAKAEHTRRCQALANAYAADWQVQTGEPRFAHEIATHADLTELQANFSRSAAAAKTKCETRRKDLCSAREAYNRTNSTGYDPEREDNTEFDAILQEIAENRLPDYLNKIRDAKSKAIEQFQDEFIGVLHNNIRNAERAIRDLNNALRTPFSEDRYAFKITPDPEYRRYYDMLTDPMNMESYTLYSETFRQKYHNEIEELFGALTNTQTADVDKRVALYTNYRTYLNFDLTVTSPDGMVQRLSRTMDKKSGGETQTPFYIAVLASFAQIYRMDRDPRGSTIRLIVFDEAFSKMDGDRIAQSLKILREFQFQAVLSAPTDKIGDIATLVDRNLCVLRKGHTALVRPFDPRGADHAVD